MTFKNVSLAAAFALLSFACGSDNNKPGQGGVAAPYPQAPSAPGTTAQNVMISISSNAMSQGAQAFGPNPMMVPVGATVTWMNNDSVPHTATSDTGLFDTGLLSPGQSGSWKATQAGSFVYHCTVHPGMKGTLQVK